MPGYGNNGFYIPAVGLHEWDRAAPAKTKDGIPSYVPGIALGFGRLPRYSRHEVDEAIRVKES